jgi:hypothetical protein
MDNQHKYDNPELPALLVKALAARKVLNNILFEIQEMTGIPGLCTDINSDDETPGVNERLEYMEELDPEDRNLEMFISYDED